MSKLQVWHIPQVPMQGFYVDVDSIEQGKWLMDVLADYDAFQYENHVKPDYCNASGLRYIDTDGEWSDLDPDDEDEVVYVQAILDGSAVLS